MKYYIAENGTQAGPFEINELFQHGLTVNSLVWCEGMANWQPAGQVAELAAAIAAQSVAGGGTQLPPTSGIPTGIPTGNPLPTGNQQQYPLPTGNQPQQSPFPQTQQGGGYTTQQQRMPSGNNTQGYLMPKTWITSAVVVAVMSLLCCSNPIAMVAAIVAIFKGMRVKSNYNNGNYEAANKASQSAKMWIIIAIVIMVVWFCVSAYRLWTNPEYLQQILEQLNAQGVTVPFMNR